MSALVPKLAYTVKEFSQACGIGRTRVYEEIGRGTLRTVKFGRTRLIPADAALEFVASLRSRCINAKVTS